MIYYTPDMFDVSKIEEELKPLVMQKETLEFQLNNFQEKYDLFRRVNYKEMLVYERRKEVDPTLLPDVIVLQQIKEIESDPAVTEFRQTLNRLKRELKNVSTKLDNETIKIKRMFTFKQINMERYLNQLNMYYNQRFLFNDLMVDIFNTEFNNGKMYYEIAALRNYDILNLLIQKAPSDWKDFMMLIFEEAKYVYTKEDMQLVEDFDIIENGIINTQKLSVLARAKYSEKIGNN